MQIKDVFISKGMTINLGNFNSTKVEVGITATLTDAAEFDQDLEKLADLVNIKLAQEVEKVLPKRQPLMETRKKRNRD